jgi:3-oxoadipate enol-lactonase
MPFHTVRNIEVYAECKGSGPRLFYIGGTGGDLRRHPNVFDSPLAEHFEVLTLDQRGLGQTSKPDVPFTIADYAADAAGLLDAYGWSSCHVMGVSFGGMVAQEFALLDPERVKRLVLACSSSGGPGGSSYPIHEYFDLSAEDVAKRSLQVQDTRRDDVWQNAHPDEVRAAIAAREATLRTWVADPAAEMGQRRQLAARWDHDTYARLRLLRMPVLIAGGRYDGQAPPANQEALHQLIPGSHLEFFEGGHLFLGQDPEAYRRVIAFLSEASAPA